jgi:hypothetical protein
MEEGQKVLAPAWLTPEHCCHCCCSGPKLLAAAAAASCQSSSTAASCQVHTAATAGCLLPLLLLQTLQQGLVADSPEVLHVLPGSVLH